MFPDPIIVESIRLKKPGVLDLYKNKGYTYIRQVHRPYNVILRYPCIGCIVELTCWKDIGSQPIDSPRAQKLMGRLSYFGYL